MAILPILEVPDARLRRISEPVAAVTDEIRALIADMFETMYDAPGIGLAAAQVDVPIRLLVMDLGDGPEDEEGKGTPNPRVFINPELYDPSEDYSVYNEGCLSVPGEYGIVKRPGQVTVRAQDRYGKTFEVTGTGITARCFCHEIDHLDGILFTQRAERMLSRDELGGDASQEEDE